MNDLPRAGTVRLEFTDNWPIKEPVTADRRVGFDQFKQFTIVTEMEQDTGSWSMTHIADVRLDTCPICGRGWELNWQSMRNQVWNGDTNDMVHRTCLEGHIGMIEKLMWLNALYPAKFVLTPENTRFDLQRLPNQYGGAWNTPWYTLKVLDARNNIHIMVFGRQKRVYSIEIDALTRDHVAALQSEFAAEEVTKEGGSNRFLIHAWDDDKAQAYLFTIARVLADYTLQTYDCTR